ncbi:MAG: GNAT family N-acetyltransferase [Stenotrophomonas sp.]|uniref:GNAT family N-acetyltransferase n=1 Tax=Stenotrophomonas sp. TaxID=69392 RepID=UPI003D6D6529
MIPAVGFQVEIADYAVQRELLHSVRHAVFVDEQRVPAELEIDDLDPLSVHALAVDAEGHAIGAGRLTPDRRIGRMAVLADWRSRGVGDALLQTLVNAAKQRDWGEVSLHAQLHARDFYARNGFLTEGAPFEEAGIGHQTMRMRLDGAMRIEERAHAIAATATVIHHARRALHVQLRGTDDLLAQPLILSALRRFATARHDKTVQLLVHETDLPALPEALLALAQRLPSVFQLREPVDPMDCQVVSAAISNDKGDCYFRPMGARIEGELWLDASARTRMQEELFQRIWQRSRVCSALRALGI